MTVVPRQPTQLLVTMKNSSDRELIFKFNLRADLDGINLLYADKKLLTLVVLRRTKHIQISNCRQILRAILKEVMIM